MKQKFRFEVCANSVESCMEAERGGAHRIELCTNMAEGGTTPSYGAMQAVRCASAIHIQVLIRPRGGDFLYTPLEKKAMMEDVKAAYELGMDGIVVGCLTPEGDIDIPFYKELVRLFYKYGNADRSVTFSRAFDRCRNPEEAMEQLIEAGCDRILTSGRQATAEQGIPLLKKLVAQAAGRIIIMPGGGIDENNIVRIAEETQAQEFHFSARRPVTSQMLYQKQGEAMNGTETYNEFIHHATDANAVQRIIDRLSSSKSANRFYQLLP